MPEQRHQPLQSEPKRTLEMWLRSFEDYFKVNVKIWNEKPITITVIQQALCKQMGLKYMH